MRDRGNAGLNDSTPLVLLVVDTQMSPQLDPRYSRNAYIGEQQFFEDSPEEGAAHQRKNSDRLVAINGHGWELIP
ncbi:MAG TPA: hypothetical protein VFZ59_17645 [Verrucomicrobiae bacterium]|nr:hypothetical protein [Verrucomicrobiae bacterium]